LAWKTSGASGDYDPENIRDAYMMMVLEEVPEKYEMKEIAL
jgi:hypothetical protein